MYCENCGNKLSPGDKFCQKCGRKVESSIENNFNENFRENHNKDFKNNLWMKPLVAAVFSVVLILGTYFYEIYTNSAVENMRIKAEGLALKGNINEASELINKALAKRPNDTSLKMDVKCLADGRSVDYQLGKLPELIKNHKYDDAMRELDKANDKIKNNSGKFYEFLSKVIEDRKSGITVLQIKSEMNNKNSIDELAALLMKISSYNVKEANDVKKQLKKRIGSIAYNNANECLKNNDFSGALEAVEKGLKYDNGDKKLISFKESINKQKERFERAESERIEKAMEAAAVQDKNDKTKAVKVLNKKCYVDEYGDLIISGQIKNIASRPIAYIEVYFTVYDKENNVLGTDSSYVYPQYLSPNEEGEFFATKDAAYTGDHISVDRITWYLD